MSRFCILKSTKEFKNTQQKFNLDKFALEKILYEYYNNVANSADSFPSDEYIQNKLNPIVVTEDRKIIDFAKKHGYDKPMVFDDVNDFNKKLQEVRNFFMDDLIVTYTNLAGLSVIKVANFTYRLKRKTIEQQVLEELKKIAKAQITFKGKETNVFDKSWVKARGGIKAIIDALKNAKVNENVVKKIANALKLNPDMFHNKTLSEIVNILTDKSNSNLRSVYNDAVSQEIDSKLEQHLIDFLKQYGIVTKEASASEIIQRLKETYKDKDIDAFGLGAFDVINNIIYLAENRNKITAPEEFAHAFVELMSAIGNEDYFALNREVEKTNIYKETYEKYKDTYTTEDGKPDLLMIRKEAIGQALASAIVDRWNNQNSKQDKKDKSFLDRIIEWFNKIIDLFKGNKLVTFNKLVKDIATDVLNNDHTRLNKFSYEKWLTYKNAVRLNKQELFFQSFTPGMPEIKPNIMLQHAIYKMVDYVNDRIEGKDVHPFFLLNGKAGTGKTTIINLLLNELEKEGKVNGVIVSAVANKAKQNLYRKTDHQRLPIKSSSISGVIGKGSFLHKNASGTGYYRTKKDKFGPIIEFNGFAGPKDILIIDECSMISSADYRDLIELLKKRNITLIFVGDSGLLPEIDNKAGKRNTPVSPTFTESNAKYATTLTERVRQGEDNPILQASDLFYVEGYEVSKADPSLNLSLRGLNTKITDNGAVIVKTPDLFDYVDDAADLFKRAIETGNTNLVKYVCATNNEVAGFNEQVRRSIFGPEYTTMFKKKDFVMFREQCNASRVGRNKLEKIDNSQEGIITDFGEYKEGHIYNDPYLASAFIHLCNAINDYVARNGENFPLDINQIDPELLRLWYKLPFISNYVNSPLRKKNSEDKNGGPIITILDKDGNPIKHNVLETIYMYARRIKDILPVRTVKVLMLTQSETANEPAVYEMPAIHPEDWEKYERNIKLLNDNTYIKGTETNIIGVITAHLTNAIDISAIDEKTRRQLGAELINTYTNARARLLYGYAITSHKSQGSTYDVSIINGDSMARNSMWGFQDKQRMMYTAMTRSSNITMIITSQSFNNQDTESLDVINERINKNKKKSKVDNTGETYKPETSSQPSTPLIENSTKTININGNTTTIDYKIIHKKNDKFPQRTSVSGTIVSYNNTKEDIISQLFNSDRYKDALNKLKEEGYDKNYITSVLSTDEIAEDFVLLMQYLDTKGSNEFVLRETLKTLAKNNNIAEPEVVISEPVPSDINPPAIFDDIEDTEYEDIPNISEPQQQEQQPSVLGERVEYTPVNRYGISSGVRQTYYVNEGHIYDANGNELTNLNSKNRVGIYTNLRIQRGEAVIVEHKGNKYVVNNNNQIVSVKTRELMKWDEKNGDRKAILQLAKLEFEQRLTSRLQLLNPELTAPVDSTNSTTNNSTEKVNYTQSSGSYALRTRENVGWSDITFAIAIDDETAGEKLTRREAVNQRKYVLEYLPHGLDLSLIPRLARNFINGISGINAEQSYGHKGKKLPTQNVKLNIAGNGVYTLAERNISQDDIDRYVFEYIKELINQGMTISEIRSGGQTGVDEAGIKAGLALGIPVSVHAPKGYTFRNVNGKDISNEKLFKDRFNDYTKLLNPITNTVELTSPEVLKEITDQVVEHLQKLNIKVHTREELISYLKKHGYDNVLQQLDRLVNQKEMEEIKRKAIADGTFMKAPNGQPTKLNEKQWLQVRTKAFKEWFGDWENDPKNASKVIDDKGEDATFEPLVVYHGGAKDVQIFKNGGTNTESGYYIDSKTGEKIWSDSDRAVFFSSEKYVASSYALLYAFNYYNKLLYDTDSLIETFSNGSASYSKDRFNNIEGVYNYLDAVSEFNPRFGKLKDYIKKLLAENKRLSEREVKAARELLINLRETVLKEYTNHWNLNSSSWDYALYKGREVIDEYNSIEGVRKLLNGEIPNTIKKEFELFKEIEADREKIGLSKIANYDKSIAWLSSPATLSEASYTLKYDGKELFFDNTRGKRDVPVSEMTLEEILQFFKEALESNKKSIKDRNKDDVKLKYAEKSQIYEAFLNIRNPLIHDYRGTHQGQGYRLNAKYQFGYVAARLVNKAIKDGNDGVVYLNLYDPYLADNYGVFDPNQIKSATDNVGTFSRTNDDIRMYIEMSTDSINITGNEFKNSLFRGLGYTPLIDENGNLHLHTNWDLLSRLRTLSFDKTREGAEHYGRRAALHPFIIEIDEDFIDKILPKEEYSREKVENKKSFRYDEEFNEVRLSFDGDLVIPKGKFNITQTNETILLNSINDLIGEVFSLLSLEERLEIEENNGASEISGRAHSNDFKSIYESLKTLGEYKGRPIVNIIWDMNVLNDNFHPGSPVMPSRDYKVLIENGTLVKKEDNLYTEYTLSKDFKEHLKSLGLEDDVEKYSNITLGETSSFIPSPALPSEYIFDNSLPFYTTPQGEVYGFVTPEGDIYLDENVITPEHPIHEYTHLWDKAVQQRNSKLWNRGITLMKQTSLWNEIANSEQYGTKWKENGVTGKQLDDLIASEVHARLVGTEGQQRLELLAKEKGSKGIIAKLKQWLLDFWKELKDTFGAWNQDELNNLTLEEFNMMTLRDFVLATPLESVRELSKPLESRIPIDMLNVNESLSNPFSITKNEINLESDSEYAGSYTLNVEPTFFANIKNNKGKDASRILQGLMNAVLRLANVPFGAIIRVNTGDDRLDVQVLLILLRNNLLHITPQGRDIEIDLRSKDGANFITWLKETGAITKDTATQTTGTIKAFKIHGFTYVKSLASIRNSKQMKELNDKISGKRLRSLAMGAVYKISDLVTLIQDGDPVIEQLFSEDRLDTIKNLKGKDRITIIKEVTIPGLRDIVKDRFFNLKASSLVRNLALDNLNRKKRKEIQAIYDNFEAFINFGYVKLEALEGISVNANPHMEERFVELFDNEDESTILEIYGSSLEHWQVGFRSVSAISNLSRLIKNALDNMYDFDENFDVVSDEYGLEKRISSSQAVTNMLSWFRDVENVDDMIKVLKDKIDKHPWLMLLVNDDPNLRNSDGRLVGIGKLITVDKNGGTHFENELFQSQFFNNMYLYFQKYGIIQANGNIKVVNDKTDIDGITKELITNLKINPDIIKDNIPVGKQDDNFVGKVIELRNKIADKLKVKTITIDDDVIETVEELFNTLGITQFDKEAIKSVLTAAPRHLILISNSVSPLKGIINKFLSYNSNSKEADKEFWDSIKNDLANIIKPFSDFIINKTEAVTYQDGKLYYSYVLPSYMSKFNTKIKNGNGFMEKEFKSEFFGLTKDGKKEFINEWLKKLAESKLAREDFSHKVVLSDRGVSYTKKTPKQYMNSILREYLYHTNKRLAWYKVPMMSNKPSEEYIRFYRYTDGFKDKITDLLVGTTMQEILRIADVVSVARRIEAGLLPEEYNVKFYNIKVSKLKEGEKAHTDEELINLGIEQGAGTRFVMVSFLQPYLEAALKDRSSNELGSKLLDLILGYNENTIKESDPNDFFIDELESTETTLSLLKKAIQSEMDINFQDFLSTLKAEGVIEENEKGEYKTEVSKLGKNNKEIENTLEEYFWNDFYAALSIMQLYITDPIYYGNAEELQKRLALLHAPGSRMNVNATYKGKPFSALENGRHVYRQIKLLDDEIISDAISNVKTTFDKLIEENRNNAPLVSYYKYQRDFIVNKLSKVNVTDAQTFCTPTAMRKKLGMLGLWNEAREQAYQRLCKGEISKSDLSILMQPLKPFMFSLKQVSDPDGLFTTRRVGVLVKTSEYLLLLADAISRGANKDTKLSAIFDVIEESLTTTDPVTGNKIPNGKGIDAISFESAVKTGLGATVNLNNLSNEQVKIALRKAIYAGSDGTNITSEYNSIYVDELDYEDYSIQQEVPTHFFGKQQLGSQSKALVFADVEEYERDENGEYKVDENGERIPRYIYVKNSAGKRIRTTVAEAKQKYFSLLAQSIEAAKDLLIRELNLDNANQNIQNVAISELLKKQILEDARFGSDLLWAVDTNEKGEFNLPLSDPTHSIRIQLLLYAVIKDRIYKQLIHGGPVVQVSNWGTEDLHIRYTNKDGETLLTEDEFNQLKQRAKDNENEKDEVKKKAERLSILKKLSRHASTTVKQNGKVISLNTYEQYKDYHMVDGGIVYECYAPVYHERLLKYEDPDTGIIDVDAIRKEEPLLLELIGYRIPTEAKYSMASLRIVGFLPREAGEGIMLPKEWTAISGSDFDVDKLYIMRRSFDEYVDGERGIRWLKGKTKQDLINDEIFDIMQGVLESNQALSKVVKIGTFDPLKLVGYKLAALREAKADVVRQNAEISVENTIRPQNDQLEYKEVTDTYDTLPNDINVLKNKAIKNKNLAFAHTHLLFFKQNMVAAKLIGVFALSNISHAYLSMYASSIGSSKGILIEDLSFSTFKLFNNIINPNNFFIDSIYGFDGTPISDNIAAFLAASVDAVKDPILNLMNINMKTVNAAMIMARIGFSIELIGLLFGQDIVSELVQRMDKYGEDFSTALHNKLEELKSVIKKDPELSGVNFDLDLNEKELKDNLVKSSLLINYTILLILKQINDIADSTRSIVHMTRFNSISSAKGPNIINAIVEQLKTDAYWKSLGKYNFELNDAISNPVLSTTTNTVDELERVLIGNRFVLSNSHFAETYYRYLEITGADVNLIDNKDAKKFSDFYMDYMVHKVSKLFDLSYEHRLEVMSTYPQQILALKSDPRFTDNKFVLNIQLRLDAKDEYLGIDIELLNALSDDIEEIKTDFNEFADEEPEMTKKIIEYMFNRGGFSFSPKTFTNLITNYIKDKLMSDYLKNLRNLESDKGFLNNTDVTELIEVSDDIINQYLLHYGSKKFGRSTINSLEDINSSIPTDELKLGDTFEIKDNRIGFGIYLLTLPSSNSDKKVLLTVKVNTVSKSSGIANVTVVEQLGGNGQGIEINPGERVVKSIYTKKQDDEKAPEPPTKSVNPDNPLDNGFYDSLDEAVAREQGRLVKQLNKSNQFEKMKSNPLAGNNSYLAQLMAEDLNNPVNIAILNQEPRDINEAILFAIDIVEGNNTEHSIDVQLDYTDSMTQEMVELGIITLQQNITAAQIDKDSTSCD